MFLAPSDRPAKSEGELRAPHDQAHVGSHPVIYIFTDATGDLSLYYDIKLKEHWKLKITGGAVSRNARL